MNEGDCLKRYQEILASWNVDEATSAKLFGEIVQAYSHKKRFYHNVDHLTDLLTHSNENSSALQHRDVVDMAIFYHDVVYKPSRKDNEEKSAQMAEKVLKRLRVPETHIQTVAQYIRATQHHASDMGHSDLGFFLDFDLAILGASKDVYDRYTEAIRKEYKIYPDFLYKPGRKKALQHFLERDKIFKTNLFFDRYEKNARINIESEIRSLGA